RYQPGCAPRRRTSAHPIGGCGGGAHQARAPPAAQPHRGFPSAGGGHPAPAPPSPGAARRPLPPATRFKPPGVGLVPPARSEVLAGLLGGKGGSMDNFLNGLAEESMKGILETALMALLTAAAAVFARNWVRRGKVWVNGDTGHTCMSPLILLVGVLCAIVA